MHERRVHRLLQDVAQPVVSTSAPPRCLDGRDLDLLHRHHRREGTLGLKGDNMGIPLSNVEPLAYVVGAAIAVLVAVLASLTSERRAASVQPMVALRTV